MIEKLIQAGILTALISPMAFGVGYIFRTKIQSNQDRKLALYLLLEIWHKLVIFQKYNSDEYLTKVLLKVSGSLTANVPSEDTIKQLKQELSPIILEHSKTQVLGNLQNFERKYQEAIELVASNDPVLAYKISSASEIESLTQSMNSLLENYFSSAQLENFDISELQNQLTHTASNLITSESIIQLERNLLTLAERIGLRTYFACKKRLSFKKDLLRNIENSNELENYLEKIFPLLQLQS